MNIKCRQDGIHSLSVHKMVRGCMDDGREMRTNIRRRPRTDRHLLEIRNTAVGRTGISFAGQSVMLGSKRMVGLIGKARHIGKTPPGKQLAPACTFKGLYITISPACPPLSTVSHLSNCSTPCARRALACFEPIVSFFPKNMWSPGVVQ